MTKKIYGIQQIGIGTDNFVASFQWYIDHFGFDARIFEDNTVAELMLPYTGGEPHQRRAALVMNLQGGGGMEIWQYKDRTPQPPAEKIQLGDLGINCAKVKCPDVQLAHSHLIKLGVKPLGQPANNPNGEPHFFVNDPAGNIFDIVHDSNIFKNQHKPLSGMGGAIIGVSNIDDAMRVYSKILGYDQVLFDKTQVFDDLAALPGGNQPLRRVLLAHATPRVGGFSKLLGPSRIELIQCTNRIPQKIFKNRFWGDIGFIHLCFDVKDMDALQDECNAQGCKFTVNSNVKGRFDMGDAAGHFTYIEDPDGTLIEFVETHKVPLIKALGINLNMTNKAPDAKVPDWILNLLNLKRVKKVR